MGALMLCSVRLQWRERREGPRKSRGEGRGGRGGRGGYAEPSGIASRGALHGPRALQRGSLYGADTDEEEEERRRRDGPSDEDDDDDDEESDAR